MTIDFWYRSQSTFLNLKEVPCQICLYSFPLFLQMRCELHNATTRDGSCIQPDMDVGPRFSFYLPNNNKWIQNVALQQEFVVERFTNPFFSDNVKMESGCTKKKSFQCYHLQIQPLCWAYPLRHADTICVWLTPLHKYHIPAGDTCTLAWYQHCQASRQQDRKCFTHSTSDFFRPEFDIFLGVQNISICTGKWSCRNRGCSQMAGREPVSLQLS